MESCVSNYHTLNYFDHLYITSVKCENGCLVCQVCWFVFLTLQALNLGSEEDDDSERFEALCESAHLKQSQTATTLQSTRMHKLQHVYVSDTHTHMHACASLRGNISPSRPKTMRHGQTEPVLQ